MNIIMRQDALAQGLKKYFTGKPCKHGHISERTVSKGTCLTCAIDRVEKWKHENPDKARQADTIAARIRRKNDPEAQKRRNIAYGERQRKLQIELAGREPPTCCEVCGREAYRICWDHCHITGKFRGWLCDKCNVSLGNLNDDPEILKKLIAYLEEFNGNTNN